MSIKFIVVSIDLKIAIPKDSIQNLLKLINEFIKVAGYKVNTQNLSHFYTLIIKYQRVKQRNNPTYNCIRKNKIHRNKLTTEVKDLYVEDYKTIMKETEEGTNKRIEELILSKCPY